MGLKFGIVGITLGLFSRKTLKILIIVLCLF